MGYDLKRFDEIPNVEHVLCGFCNKVLDDPIQSSDPACQHYFCRGCVFMKLLTKPKPRCPIDKKEWIEPKFKPPPRILTNLLSELKIKCENKEYGCEDKFALDNIKIHQSACPYNPEREIVCLRTCGLKFQRKNYKNHDCLFELKTEVVKLEQELQQKGELIETMKRTATEKRRKLSEMSTAVLVSLENLAVTLNSSENETRDGGQ